MQTPTATAPARSTPWWLGLVGAAVVVSLLPAPNALAVVLRAPFVWFVLAWVPGAAVLRLVEPGRQGAGEALLSGFVVSPIILCLVSMATIFAGGSPQSAVAACLVVATALAALGAMVRRPRLTLPARGQVLALGLLVAGLLVLISTLPFTREWWRIRSDAWFHAAVVAQIRDFGLPPDDPYFAGLPLQYMWFYHVVVSTLSAALRVDPFWTMAFVNAHAAVALVLAGMQFAGTLRRSFAHRFAATATLLFAFNAAFWIFLPLKIVKSFMGDVRGAEEIARTFSLTPFTYNTVLGFTNIYYNQEFFLDKYMVATAFGLSLVFLAAAWAGVIEYLEKGRRFAGALFVASLVGMLGFHSLVGFIFLAGLFGGLVLLHLTQRGVDGYVPRRALLLVVASLACLAAMSPYLYQVMHAKEREQIVPVDVSLPKNIGIVISSALVIALAMRARWFWSDRRVATRFMLFATGALTAFCFSIALPGPNTWDKLGYFVFVPLSIVGGIAVADSILARQGRARVALATAWILLFYLPVNALTFASCFATPDAVEVTKPEFRLSAWVSNNTSREALFVDDKDRVPLLVTAPRRYFWGTEAYAVQWGYPKSEMSRRRHVVQALYGPGEIDAAAFATLASVEEPLYVVVRPEHHSMSAAVVRYPEFEIVYQDPDISLARVDRDACVRRAQGQTEE